MVDLEKHETKPEHKIDLAKHETEPEHKIDLEKHGTEPEHKIDLAKYKVDLKKHKKGIELNLTPEGIHRQVLKYLISNICSPTDVLEEAEIESVKAFYIPAYYYHGKDDFPFSCKVCTQNGQDNINRRSVHSSVEDEIEGVGSGNPDYDFVIAECKTEDIQSFAEHTESVTIIKNTVGYTKFRTAIAEQWEKQIEKNAKSKAGSRSSQSIEDFHVYRDTNMLKVDKVLIGVYQVTCRYKEIEYICYIAGNGKFLAYQESPVGEENESVKSDRDVLNGRENSLEFFSGTITTIVAMLYLVKLLFYDYIDFEDLSVLAVIVIVIVMGLALTDPLLLGALDAVIILILLGRGVGVFTSIIVGALSLSFFVTIWAKVLKTKVKKLDRKLEAHQREMKSKKEAFEFKGNKIKGAEKLELHQNES